LIAGLGVIAWLVWRADPYKVLLALEHAGWWLPLLALLEIIIQALDVMGARSQLGAHASKVPLSAWVRSSTLAFALGILLPAGGAAGEIARAAILGRHTGIARAAVASAGFNGAKLFSIAILSFVAAIFAALGPEQTHLLAIALVINGVVVGTIGTVISIVLRSRGAAKLVVRRLKLSSALHGEVREAIADALHLPRAVAWCTVARLFQWLQYGVFVAAIGGTVGVSSASLAQGIHLIGASAGDFIPGQAAAFEAAYAAFASAIQLSPDRAVALPLLHRMEMLGLALACLVTATVLRRSLGARPAAEPTSS
jgi:hypothetical protein